MKRFDRGTIQARAQEIVFSSKHPITGRDACRQVLRELYGDDPEALLEAAATFAAGALTGLRQRTYHLPEQPALAFELPAIIAITTPDGDKFIRREDASTDETRQYVKEGLQWSSTVRLRFKRAAKDLALAEDIPGNVPYPELHSIIEERKSKMLENGK